MNRGTCKFYTGDHHNTHCAAGVCYRDVTKEPDRIEGSAFRKPCVDWDQFNREHGKGFDNELQAQEWAKRGHCDKREEPTDEEVATYEAESKARMKEILASLNQPVKGIWSGSLGCSNTLAGRSYFNTEASDVQR